MLTTHTRIYSRIFSNSILGITRLSNSYNTLVSSYKSGSTGSQIVHEYLQHHGVSAVFGYTGGAILPITDQFYDSPIKYIMNRTELCVGHAAEGYAKSTGKPGIIITTSGPGVTNLITPLQDALSDGVPLIAFTGQVPTSVIGTNAFQECPALELTKACTKWNYQPKDVHELPEVLEEAYHIATSGRKGPVHIDLPKDVVSDKLERDITIEKKVVNTDTIDILKIKELGKLLKKARKPIIYAGQGCVEASKELRIVAKIFKIPVTTTLHAMGVYDERDPLSLHMVGMHGSAYANFSIQEADLILAIGSRFDDRTTGKLSDYVPEALRAEREGRGGIVHFDIEPSQIGRVIQPTLSFVGDCKEYLSALISYADFIEIPDRTNWIHRIAQLKKEYPFSYKKTPNIKTQEVISKIYELTRGQEPFITTGVGNHQMMSCQFYRWSKPRSIISSGSLGTMGFGLPSAIGVQVANPKSKVYCIDGDGSFMMTLNDLATVREHNLPIKIFIMNDSRQQMVHIWQKLFFNSRFISTDNLNPDFNLLAESFGIESIRIQDRDELEAGLQLALEYDGPVLVNCIVEPDMCTPLVAPNSALDNMLMSDDGNIHLEGLAPN
jgi:acetolactate synthase I/II/III large subunit